MGAIRRLRRGMSAVAGVALVCAGLAAGGTQALARQEHGAAIVGDSVLVGVTCVSKTDCWAVGSAELNNVTRNRILHFNGRKWYPVPAPSPGGTALDDSSYLSSVRCTSPANCWAVGSFDSGDASRTQVLHWTGRKWSRLATPDPGGINDGDFASIGATQFAGAQEGPIAPIETSTGCYAPAIAGTSWIGTSAGEFLTATVARKGAI